ncbi:10730_t:CDS:1, partial [Funneliformis caledonium]
MEKVMPSSPLPSSPSPRDVLGKRRSIDIIVIILQIFLTNYQAWKSLSPDGKSFFRILADKHLQNQ